MYVCMYVYHTKDFFIIDKIYKIYIQTITKYLERTIQIHLQAEYDLQK